MERASATGRHGESPHSRIRTPGNIARGAPVARTRGTERISASGLVTAIATEGWASGARPKRHRLPRFLAGLEAGQVQANKFFSVTNALDGGATREYSRQRR